MSQALGNKILPRRRLSGENRDLTRHPPLAVFVLLLLASLGTALAANACEHDAPTDALTGKLNLRYSVHRRADTRVRFELIGIDAGGQVHEIGQAEYPIGPGRDIPFSIPIDAEQVERFDRHRLNVLVAEDPAFEVVLSTTQFELTPGQLGSFLNLAIQPTPRPIP